MGYRGRLIFPFLIDLYRLDLQATSELANPADGRAQGFDPVYREPIILPTASRTGAPARAETLIQLPGQIEPEAFNRQQMAATGDQKGGFWGISFHFGDLEELGLLNEQGIALIKPGDRLGAIRRMKDESLVQEFPDPPGMFAIDATPSGFGLGGERNLLLVKFQART